MFRLRTLAVLSLVSSSAFGLSQTFFTTVDANVRNGSLDISDLNRKFSVSNVSERVGYRADSLLGPLSAQGFVVVSQPDYSSVLVRDIQGKEQTLQDRVGSPSEISTELTVDAIFSSHTFTLGWSGNVTDSPFSSSIARLGYAKTFYNNAIVLGANATYLHQDQPESYYFDSGFRIQRRPAQVYGNEVGVYYEQILTENWKSRLEITSSVRLGERPRNWAANLKQGYALTDTVFAHFKINYGTEGRTQELLNERGYFDQWGASLEVTYEPIYDLYLSASYGLLIERESDPRIGRVLQVASDQYGLGATYQLASMEISLRTGYLQSNTNIYNYTLSGGVTWRL